MGLAGEDPRGYTRSLILSCMQRKGQQMTWSDFHFSKILLSTLWRMDYRAIGNINIGSNCNGS